MTGRYLSFAEVTERDGATAGFDYLRIALAVAVVAIHSFRIVEGPAFAGDMPPWLLGTINLILPMFFSLSGFLVTASLLRLQNLKTFLVFRALRIFPALIVEVVLSAVLLGALLTTLPVGEYFTSPDLGRYLLNVSGHVTPESMDLPGVFETHPTYEANGSLWTVPFELECYIALSILALATVTRRPLVCAAAVCAWCGYIVLTTIFDPSVSPVGLRWRWLEATDVFVSQLLLPSFLAGGAVRLLADRLPMSVGLGAASLILSAALLSSPQLYGLAPLTAAYGTAWLGLLNPQRLKIVESGDYSYGVYLYAYPLQQLVYGLGEFGRQPLMNLGLSLVLVAAFAAFSWHVVEKPTLGLKRRLFGKPARKGLEA